MARRTISPVRLRDGVWEARCGTCCDWWALDTVNWTPWRGMTRCRACWRLFHAQRDRTRRADAAVAAAKREANRAYRAAHRATIRAACQAWRDRNRERVAAYNKAYREAHRELTRERSRAYHAVAGAGIRLKKRAKYRGDVAA